MKNDGGPAFPVETKGTVSQPGMSLRDYFAARAMQAYITIDTGRMFPDKDIAKWSFNTADAMLKAREK